MNRQISDSVLQTTKLARQMAEASLAKLLFQIIGGGYYGYVLFINIENVKGWILICLAVVYAVINIDYKRKINKQKIRETEYRLWELEREKRRKDKEDLLNQKS